MSTTLCACFAEPAPTSHAADAGSPKAVFRDALGARYGASATPRDLEIALDVADPAAEAASAALMPGALRTPFALSLTASSLRETRIPVALAAASGDVIVRPLEPLDPGALYTLLWLPRQAAAAFVFRTSRDPALGARFRASLPGAGAAGVPPNLARVLLAFEGDLAPGARMQLRAGDREHAGTVQTLRCESLALPAGACIVFTPTSELAPHTRYELRAESLASTTGARLSPVALAFETGSDRDALAPRLQPLRCGDDEQRIGALCARIDDRHASLRGATDEGALVSLAIAPHLRAVLSTANLFELAELPLAAEGTALLRLQDVAGNFVEEPLPLAPQPPLPRVLIDELRSNPKGAEASSEYVELWNADEHALGLQGFTLAVSGRRRAVAGQATIAPGERVLIVAPEFDAELDPRLPSGVRRLGLEAALSLPNSGGTLVLRDAAGEVLSSVQYGSALVEGQCHARASEDRDRRSVALLLDPDGACTPGAPTLHAP